MPPSTLATKLPGAPAEPDAPPDITGGQADTLVTVTQAQLNAMVANAVAAQRVASAPRPVEADLPDAASLDPHKLTEMVLTKTGWVVPPKYGMPAAAQIAQR